MVNISYAIANNVLVLHKINMTYCGVTAAIIVFRAAQLKKSLICHSILWILDHDITSNYLENLIVKNYSI